MPPTAVQWVRWRIGGCLRRARDSTHKTRRAASRAPHATLGCRAPAFGHQAAAHLAPVPSLDAVSGLRCCRESAVQVAELDILDLGERLSFQYIEGRTNTRCLLQILWIRTLSTSRHPAHGTTVTAEHFSGQCLSAPAKQVLPDLAESRPPWPTCLSSCPG